MRKPESAKGRVKAPELTREGIGIGDMEIDTPGGYAFLGNIQYFLGCVGRDDVGGFRRYELGPIAGSASHFEDALM